MATAPRRSGGLAARVVKVTLTVGVATVVTAGAVALVNTSGLAAQRAAARDLVALQLVEGTIEERLNAATGVLDRVSTLASAAETRGPVANATVQLFAASRAIFDEIIVAEMPGGRIVVAAPEEMTRAEVRRLQPYREALGGVSGFTSVRRKDETAEFWIMRTTVGRWGTPVVVLGRLDSGFIQRALMRSVKQQPGRVALLVSGGELVGRAGIDEDVDLAGAVWTPEGGGLGRVRFRSAAGVAYRGRYNEIEGARGVSWRAVAGEPVAADLSATVRAVGPSIAVLILGGAVALLLAWGISTQLVKPLRELERTARTAASGAYVKPLPTSRDDEIGLVAVAFNQVALRLNALHDLSQLLASASRLDQVLDGILSAMGHIVGPGAAAIYLLDEEGARLKPARTRGINMSSVREVDMSRGGWLARALRESGPVTLAGGPSVLREEIPGIAGGAQSALVAPLIAGREPLGIVVILRDDERTISDAELEMVRTFSAQAAVAVQTSRLFQVETESRRIAEALRNVAEQLVRPEALDAALRNVERITSDLFGARIACIVLADPEALGLSPEVNRAESGELMDLALRCIGAQGGPVSVGWGVDMAVDRLLDEYDGQGLMVAPIALETDHGGVLMVVTPGEPEAERSDVMRALADEIALALDNAYFYQRAVTRATNLETIFKISQAVGSSLQLKVVLNRVLDVVQKILSAEAVMLWTYDSRRRTLGTAMVRGDVPARIVHLELGPGEDLPGRVFQSGEPVMVRDLETGMPGVAGSVAQREMRSLLAVPLLARGRPIGVLMVLSSVTSAFSDEDMNVLQTFASQAALAIDTARLYGREHEVAHVLQQSILPEALPDFPEVEAGSVYAPAGGDADIGGDYYDLFRGPDDAIWFAMADVCGKGVQASTKTSMIKYTLRALVAAGMSPARVIAEVNRITADAGDASDIVTVWIGKYEASGRRLVWADGGHPPAVLRRSNGAVELLGTTGPLLGALRDARFEERAVPFGPGDRVLLFTDGVSEARQGNTFFGEQRIAASLSGDKSPHEDARLLLESVRGFVDADLRDDIAILVVAARDTQQALGSGETAG